MFEINCQKVENVVSTSNITMNLNVKAANRFSINEFDQTVWSHLKPLNTTLHNVTKALFYHCSRSNQF